MKKLAIALLFLLPGFVIAQKKVNPASFAKKITPDDLKKHLYIVAGKEMEGRETASPGQKKAAAYIESQFRSLGLTPGNHGDYQLKFPVYQDSLLSASISINGKSFDLDKDFSVNVAQTNNSTYRFAEVVFVGNGISDSTRNDYKGLDVQGKIVMLLAGQQQQGRGRGGFGNQFARIDAAQKIEQWLFWLLAEIFPGR
jgi:hypothetical protein